MEIKDGVDGRMSGFCNSCYFYGSSLLDDTLLYHFICMYTF